MFRSVLILLILFAMCFLKRAKSFKLISTTKNRYFRYDTAILDSTNRGETSTISTVVPVVVRNEEEIRALIKEKNEYSDTSTKVMNGQKKDMITAQLFDAASLDETFLKSLTAKRSYYSIVAERLMQSLDDYQLSNSIKKSNELAMKSLSHAG